MHFCLKGIKNRALRAFLLGIIVCRIVDNNPQATKGEVVTRRAHYGTSGNQSLRRSRREGHCDLRKSSIRGWPQQGPEKMIGPEVEYSAVGLLPHPESTQSRPQPDPDNEKGHIPLTV